MLITNLILIILFYFLGSIPFGYLLTKIFGFGDIRNIGSGNVGATNVLRTGNKYLAFINKKPYLIGFYLFYRVILAPILGVISPIVYMIIPFLMLKLLTVETF